MAHIKIALTNLGKYNEGILDYVWVELPATEEELDAAYDKIEVCHGDKEYFDEVGNPYEEVFISDYETDLGIEIGEYDSINNLNEIAEEVDNLNEYDLKVFNAACEAGMCDAEDITTFDSGDYSFYENVSTPQDLAYEYIDQVYGGDLEALGKETLQEYFDYESYGRDIRLQFHIWDELGIDQDDEEEVARVCAEYGVDDIEDIDCYLYYGVSDDTELGYYYVDSLGWEGIGEDELENNFDYEAFGDSIAQDGDFVSTGFIETF